MGKHRADKTQGAWAFGRYDDMPMNLDEVENLLLLEIRKYKAVPWSRHYKKFDEHKLMNKIQYIITMEIKMGNLPESLNLCYFVPPSVMCSNKPIPTVMLEAHIMAVSRHLQEKMVEPGEYRRKEHGKRIDENIREAGEHQ